MPSHANRLIHRVTPRAALRNCTSGNHLLGFLRLIYARPHALRCFVAQWGGLSVQAFFNKTKHSKASVSTHGLWRPASTRITTSAVHAVWVYHLCCPVALQLAWQLRGWDGWRSHWRWRWLWRGRCWRGWWRFCCLRSLRRCRGCSPKKLCMRSLAKDSCSRGSVVSVCVSMVVQLGLL